MFIDIIESCFVLTTNCVLLFHFNYFIIYVIKNTKNKTVLFTHPYYTNTYRCQINAIIHIYKYSVQ